MGVGRAGDQHGVDRGIGERRVALARPCAVLLGEALGRPLVDIDDTQKPSPRMARDVAGMDGADASGTELAKADHGGLFVYSCYLLSPRGSGRDPLRSNGQVRELSLQLVRGDIPLILPASRVPSLSRKGRWTSTSAGGRASGEHDTVDDGAGAGPLPH